VFGKKKEKMKELAGCFVVIIDASPANIDVGLYLDMLKFNGVYCHVGIPDKTDQSFKYDYIPLIFFAKEDRWIRRHRNVSHEAHV
jgi:D-arabinose 1-dehydrogenase-like Zn-dependent alcohol dehydrogenase